VARIRENASLHFARCSSWAAPGIAAGRVTENPVRLTHSVRDRLTRVTCGGAPVYIWPAWITFMVDVSRMPEGAFGMFHSCAGCADRIYAEARRLRGLGGYMDHVRPSLRSCRPGHRHVAARAENPWPLLRQSAGVGVMRIEHRSAPAGWRRFIFTTGRSI